MNKAILPIVAISALVMSEFLPSSYVFGQLNTEIIVKAGDEAAGTGGALHAFLNAPVISDDRSVIVMGGLTGTGVTSTNNHGIWGALSGDALGMIARREDIAPDSDDRTWMNFFSSASVGNNGQFSFRNQVLREGFTTTGDVGYWSGDLSGGSISAVAIQNSPEPGSAFNEFFRTFSFGAASVNSSGRVSFSGEVAVRSSNGGATNIRDALWLGAPIERVATEFGLAPNSELPASDWTFFGGTDLNDAGQIAFRAGTRAIGADGFDGTSIWSGDPTALGLIAKTGDIAAGAGGDTWSRLQGDGTANHPVINQAGSIAFNGRVVDSGGNERRGVWMGTQGALRMVAIGGQAAPGTDNLTIEGAGGQVGLNNSDQVMFTAFLSGPGLNANNNEAIYATDAFGQLILAVREGGNIEIDGSQFRISNFSVDDNGGGIAGDASLGTARIAYQGTFFDPTVGSIQAALTADLNDVFVDTDRSSTSLTLNDSSRQYVTTGNLMVGTAGTGDVNFEIREDSTNPAAQIVASAGNATFGGIGVNGNGIITNGNELSLSGNLTIANENSSLVADDQSTIRIEGNSIVNHGSFEVSANSLLIFGAEMELSGNGDYDLRLIADEGISLSPGSGAGSMAIRDLTMASGGEYNWEVSRLGTDGVAGTDWDLLELTDLEISSTGLSPFMINIISDGLASNELLTPQSWLIATIDGGLTGFDSNMFEIDLLGFDNSLSSSQFSIELVDIGGGTRGLTVNFSAVPEPGMTTFGILSLCAAMLVRRRRTNV